MFVALDANCNKVDIDDADPNKIYYCPFCHEELTQKRGAVRIHHFAHKQDSNCPYNIESKSPWHLDWQREWPAKFREILFSNGDEWRISDVAISDLTLEFQKSQILLPKISARTNHYRNLAEPREVIWIWDRTKYHIQELVHYWGTGKSYRPSGYFCAPKPWWVEGAIKEKWEMMAFDYDYAVVVLTGWLTKEELNCEIIDEEDDDGKILNVAKYALIFEREGFIKLMNDRAKTTKDKWSIETYIKANELNLLTSGIEALKAGNPSVDFKSVETSAKRLYGQYALSSIPSWRTTDTYTFLSMNPLDIDPDTGLSYQFVTHDLFSAYVSKEKDEFIKLKNRLLSMEFPPDVFSDIKTLDARKIDLPTLFFYLLQKLGLEVSTISKQTAIAMERPKPLKKNLEIIEVAKKKRKEIARAKAREAEEKVRREEEEKHRKALEEQAREIARAKEEAKRIAEEEKRRPFTPAYVLREIGKFQGLSPAQNSVAKTFVIDKIPAFYSSWYNPRSHRAWKDEWVELLDGEENITNAILDFDCVCDNEFETNGKLSFAKKQRKPLWRVFNLTASSLADILAVSYDGRLCPYFVLNPRHFKQAHIEKKTDVVLLDLGNICVLLTGWQPLWKVLPNEAQGTKLSDAEDSFFRYTAPFARTSLPESAEKRFDDSGRRSNMATCALFFKKEDIVSFLKSDKYGITEKRDLKKFLAKHEDEVRKNLRCVFSAIYSDEYLDEIFAMEGKYVGEMSANSYYSNPYTYLKLNVDENTGLVEGTWTLNMKEAYVSDSAKEIKSLVGEDAEEFGDIRSFEAHKIDLMKVSYYLATSILPDTGVSSCS